MPAMQATAIMSLAEARHLHGEDGRWQNFARRLLRHPDMRRMLWQRQQGQCACCGKTLDPQRMSVHHLSYQHFCISDRSERTRGQRGRLPPCRSCDRTDACLDYLQALCRLCHRRRHRPQSRE